MRGAISTSRIVNVTIRFRLPLSWASVGFLGSAMYSHNLRLERIQRALVDGLAVFFSMVVAVSIRDSNGWIGQPAEAWTAYLFPAGVSVNFVRLHPDNVVEYRCFERGINRESLACGTGALACAYVTHHLRGADEHITNVFPSRCRWYDPEARIQVSHDRTVWMLESSPTKLFEGNYVAIERVFENPADEPIGNRTTSATLVPSEPRKHLDLVAGAPVASFS